MKIHQVTHLYAPDSLAGASLYTDLASFLKEAGHDVRITTTFPYYPRLRYADEDKGKVLSVEGLNGNIIRRVGMYLPKRHSGYHRLLPELSYFYRLIRYGRFDDWEPDVIITACPMLSQAAVLRIWNWRRQIPSVVVVQDRMVDAALELGILKGPGIGSFLRLFEKYSLRSATKLVTISAGMAERLGDIGRPILVIPNWIHKTLEDNAKKIEGEGIHRERANLFYSGNLGVKQGLPQFLNSFKTLRSGWTLAIHGAGAEMDSISKAIGDCDSVKLGPLQEEIPYLQSMARASACLLTQQSGVGANFLPSKLLPALATGTPVLAVCGKDTPLGKEVEAGGFGVVISPGDNAGLKKCLNEWKSVPNQIENYSKAALARAKLYKREIILKQYEQALVSLVSVGENLHAN